MSTESKASGSMFDAVKWLVALVLFAGAVAGASDAFYLSVGVELGTLYRVLIVVALMLLAAGAALTTTQGSNFLELLKEANKERRKVVWPTPVETRQTTLIVVAVVFIVGLFLYLLDMGLSSLVILIVG